ncbi:hypothetical protein LXL04_004156 [Taraxacum kok-saghyz]
MMLKLKQLPMSSIYALYRFEISIFMYVILCYSMNTCTTRACLIVSMEEGVGLANPEEDHFSRCEGLAVSSYGLKYTCHSQRYQNQNMNAKISDFGITRIFSLDETTARSQTFAGTFGYMALEYAFHLWGQGELYRFKDPLMMEDDHVHNELSRILNIKKTKCVLGDVSSNHMPNANRLSNKSEYSGYMAILGTTNDFGIRRWKGLVPQIPKIFFSEFFDHRKASKSSVKVYCSLPVKVTVASRKNQFAGEDDTVAPEKTTLLVPELSKNCTLVPELSENCSLVPELSENGSLVPEVSEIAV